MAVTTSNGDGFALYNGVKFLKLLEYDKVKYPYAYLCVRDASAVKESYKGESMAELRLSSKPFTAYPAEGKAKFTGTFDQALYFGINGDQLAADNANIGFADGEWTLSFEKNNMTTSATGAYITLSEITWCNRDLLNEDGSVYLPTADPIPLDGCTVIEWDGDTTGLESIPADAVRTYYKVSDYIPIPQSVYAQLAAVSKETGAFSLSDATTEFSGEEGTFWGTSPEWVVCFNDGAGVTSGLYFLKTNPIEGAVNDVFVNLLAYPASGEPTYDRTAFLSGMAMGLTGKGDPTFTASDTFAKGYKVGAALRRKRVIVETDVFIPADIIL